MSALVWFARDLRINDNPALYEACAKNHNGVIGLYLIMPDIWQSHGDANCKLAFWLENLHCLQQQLQTLNVPLITIECNRSTVNQVFDKLFVDYKITNLYSHQEIEPDKKAMKNDIQKLCEKHGIHFHLFYQSGILTPGTVLKNDESPYTRFTPFKKRWWDILRSEYLCLYKKPKRQEDMKLRSVLHSGWIKRDRCSDASIHSWPSGEEAAQLRLQNFCKEKVQYYHTQRDHPSLTATSQLSAYLTAGVLSAKQCLATVMAFPRNKGVDTWINELIWRDFYYHILYFFPHVGKHQPFKHYTNKLKWSRNKKYFYAWCKGQTGIPIIDAAMRQLNQTGWMHNRLRMVTAMFLSINLWIDWRWGEHYFMQHLIDGDLALNNGGWQWSALTGAEAGPSFRIFNPYSQSYRFDANGDFIRQYCHELKHLDDKEIHQPPKMINYPQPMVDVKSTRQAAITQFKGKGIH